MYYYIVDSIRNEGKDSFEINSQSGEVFTKQIFDRETKGAFALEVEARDGAPSARPNSGGKPNTGKKTQSLNICVTPIDVTDPNTRDMFGHWLGHQQHGNRGGGHFRSFYKRAVKEVKRK